MPNRQASIQLEAGESLTCTFTNTEDAQVTVSKVAEPEDEQAFSFTTTGGFDASSFSLQDDGDENSSPSSQAFTFAGTDFDPGDETITEDGETGWTLTALNCTGDDDYQESGSTATLNVEPGETIVCDYENTAVSGVAPETGGGSRDVDADTRDPVDDGSGKFPRGRLPFTGLAAGLLLVIGLGLVAIGRLARGRPRRRMPLF